MFFTESRRCMCDKIKSDMDCGTDSKSYPTVTDEWIDNNTLSRPDAYVLTISIYFISIK